MGGILIDLPFFAAFTALSYVLSFYYFKNSRHFYPRPPESASKPLPSLRLSRQARGLCEVDSSNVHQQRLSITVNALAAAGDVLIAGILCTLLHKSRTGFQR